MEFRFFFLTFATEMYLLEGDENVLFFSLYKSLRRDGFCFAGMNLRM